MTERNDDDIVKELKRMNGFLEAIDWKLWNMHKKLVEENGDINTPTTTAEPKEASVTVTVNDDAPVVPAIPKYPSIEKWS
jgi:hypothetical protein